MALDGAGRGAYARGMLRLACAAPGDALHRVTPSQDVFFPDEARRACLRPVCEAAEACGV